MTSIYELRARRAKAEAIAAALFDSLTDDQRADAETVRAFRECENQSVRDTIARQAHQKSPSDETWVLAGNILEQRVADFARGRGLRRVG